MPKISKNASTVLSIILAMLFLIGLIVGAVILPTIINILIENSRGFIIQDFNIATRLVITISGYVALSVAGTADIFLLILLKNIREGEVFSLTCVALIRRLSWCLFLVGIVFIPLGFFFVSSWLVAFAGIFLGLCVRVVKNAFEEAVSLKEENDLTV